MAMAISATGISMIKRYEGYRNVAYQCSAGKWTIGYGHTSGVKAGDTCTEDQANVWLYQDIASAERSVNAMERWGYAFSQPQFDALVSFTFNCGAGNLAKLANGGQRTLLEMSEKILSYNKAGGRVLPGLIKRRSEESRMLKDFGSLTPAEFTVKPCIFDSIAVKPNYNIREKPSIDGIKVGSTTSIKVTQLISKCNGYIETEHGWISEQGFYDTFK